MYSPETFTVHLMTMKHFVVLLDPVSKESDFNQEQDYLRREGDNAEKMKRIVMDTLKAYNLSTDLKSIEIPDRAPVLYVECTQGALQRILQIKGVQQATDDERFTDRARVIQKQPVRKRKSFLDLFRKRT